MQNKTHMGVKKPLYKLDECGNETVLIQALWKREESLGIMWDVEIVSATHSSEEFGQFMGGN